MEVASAYQNAFRPTRTARALDPRRQYACTLTLKYICIMPRGMKAKKIQISAAESQVMEALWRKSPLTPEEIIAATAKPNGWGPGTVRTLITRLLRRRLCRARGVTGPPPDCATQVTGSSIRPRRRGSGMAIFRFALLASILAPCLALAQPAPPPPAPVPVVLPITPNGGGDPEAIVCRAPQRLADSDQLGPTVCISNHEWRQMAMNGKSLAPDGKTLINLPTMDNPKGDGDPEAVTCRTPVYLQASDTLIRRFGPEVCQTNQFWADVIKKHQMVDAQGVVRAMSVSSMGNGGDPFHNPTQGLGRTMGNSGAPF